MKPPQFLIACLSLALVAMTMVSSNRNEDQGTSKNPCEEVWENTTVSTPEGLVLCIVPSDEELTEQLKSVGGYNKHYVALTPEEAINFENILPGWDGAATTKPTKPSSTRRCRRYRKRHPSFRKRRGNGWKRRAGLEKLGWEDEKEDPEIEKIQTKRSDKSAYRRMALREQDDNYLQRNKRSDNGITESIKVGCVSKGDAIGSAKQMCDRCQRRSELEADRFPRYINEVTCESASGSPSDGNSRCQPDIGVCAQGYLLIDLLKRTDQYTEASPPSGMYFKAFKQIWVPYTHKIRSCCECRSEI